VRGAPKVVVLGGPNGAGKSTVAPELLRNALGLKEFVNADQIASGLSAFNTEAVAFEAGRIMLGRVRELARERSSFAFESTLASRTFHPFLVKLKADGYQVLVFYVALRTPELAVARVQHRVRMGGHDVPEDIVRRRFHRSLRNLFELYLPVADRWRVFDNSAGTKPTKVAEQGKSLRIFARTKWQHLQSLVQSAS
jgi:predicted ABC-type ATPase